MTVSPEAQVPNTDNDPTTAPFAIGPSPAQEPLLHTGTSLEQAVEDRVIKGMNEDGTIRIPDHVPRGLVENPDAGGAREVVPTEKAGGKLRQILVGGTALLAVGIAAFVGTKVANNNDHEATSSSEVTSSAPATTNSQAYEKYPVRLAPEGATGDQFVGRDSEYPYAYSRAEQMDYAGPKLNEDQQGTVERLRDFIGRQYSNFTEDDGQTTRKIAAPSLDNTPQQILDQIAVGTFRAWEIAQTGNIDEAKKFASVVADPNNREYQDQLNWFESQKGNINDGVAWGEQPIITSGDYEGIPASDTSPLIEFNKTSSDGSKVRMVVRFEKGDTPESMRWVLVITKKM